MSEIVGSAKAQEETKGQKAGTADKKKTAAAAKRKSPEPSLNMQELRELAELIDNHGFTDFEFENENIRVRMSKNPPPSPLAQAVQSVPPNVPVNAPLPPISTAAAQTETKTEPAAETKPPAEEELHQITSPIVGTFYRSVSPDKEPYIKEGGLVSPDTVVCIVEAMKLMNEIQAETSGEVVKIYVENGQPVEYGQPLFGIRK